MALDLEGDVKDAPPALERPKPSTERQARPSAARAGAASGPPARKKAGALAAPPTDPHLAPAQRSAAAAREAAERIRAQTARYRVAPAAPPPTKPSLTGSRVAPTAEPQLAPSAPSPPKAAPATAEENTERAGEQRSMDQAAPEVSREADAPSEADALPQTDAAAIAPAPTEVEASEQTAEMPAPARKTPNLAPRGMFRPVAKIEARAEQSPPRPAAFTFKPMRQTPDQPAPFRTAYRFQDGMSARSAGRLLIGEVRPIRPAAPDRLLGGSEEPDQGRTAPAAGPQAEPSGLDASAIERDERASALSRFDRLSNEIAEQQRRLGVDPASLGAGELQARHEPRSRWRWLGAWLRGGGHQND